jgi:transposase
MINTEANQEFLFLVWLIQNNHSSALGYIHRATDKILNRAVYRAYDFSKNEWIFSLQPVQDIQKDYNPVQNLGGRPRSLTKEQELEICFSNKSHRAMAREYNVSEGTIRNIRKKYFNN